MNFVLIRARLYLALEYFGYFLLLSFLGGSAYLLVRVRPHAEAKWYILLSFGVALICMAYAFQFYRQYRAIRRAGGRYPGLQVPHRSARQPVPRQVRRSWAERLAETDPDAAAIARARVSEPEQPEEPAPDVAQEENADAEGENSLEAIRIRIAERMEREDREREEALKDRLF